MAKISVCGNVFDIDVVVFDKDGCLFGSQAFWEGLARTRFDKLSKEMEGLYKDLGMNV